MGLMLAKFSLNAVKIAPVHLMVELRHLKLRLVVTVAVKFSASVVKDGVVLFSELKVLMLTQARALLNALNNITVLVTVDDQLALTLLFWFVK